MFNETTRLFFERSSTNETGQTRSDMLAVSKVPADTAAANRLAAASPYYNALMRTTCVATMLSGGHAENALPQTARANINCRMHPDDTPENVMATLKSIVADSLVAVERVYLSLHAPASPLRKDVMSALENVTGKMWPDVVVTPIMSTGATDGRLLREKGMPVYGISGMFGDVDDNRAHGRDERMGVREYFEGVDFMYKLMKELSTK
jgi:acetylornithine deacetylase/succinyl-diaminopimelate desuccinylase-like protein